MTTSKKARKPAQLVWGMPAGFVKFMFGVLAWILGAGVVGAMNGSGFGSGVSGLLGTVMVATICTLGAGGIVFTMIFYISGTAVFFVISKIFRIPVVSKSSLGTLPATLSPHTQSIAVYVHDAFAYGMSRELITANLKNQGWSSEQINSGFAAVEALPQSK